MNRSLLALDILSRFVICLGILAPFATGCVAESDVDLDDVTLEGEAIQNVDGQTVAAEAKYRSVANPIEGQYVVVLEDNSAEETHVRASRLAKAHHGEVSHVYGSVLRGFVPEPPTFQMRNVS